MVPSGVVVGTFSNISVHLLGSPVATNERGTSEFRYNEHEFAREPVEERRGGGIYSGSNSSHVVFSTLDIAFRNRFFDAGRNDLEMGI